MAANGNGKSLIHLDGINKVFYTDEVETHALEDVHFEITQGEYVAISGPSGCGKTTLLSSKPSGYRIKSGMTEQVSL